MNSPHAVYLWPGQTHFGYGVVDRVGNEARALGAQHAFIVTDAGVVHAGLLAPILRTLDAAGIPQTVFDKCVPNPTVDSVDRGAELYRSVGADLVIALGGGSSIDTGKGVRMLANMPEHSIADYSFLRPDARPCPASLDMPSMIAIPTTAGTGAEVTPWGVITDVAQKQKFGIGGPAVTPTVALIDPALTLGLPPLLTAATGMDALTHLIEAYVSTNEAPALDPMILHGIEITGRSLPVAVAQGNNAQAREEVMLGAMLGGIAISTRWLGACHALAHPLSAVADVPHGLANAIMLPHQMAYSLPGALEGYARIGEALGSAGSTLRMRAEGAIDAVRILLRDCELPTRLRDVGVTEEQITILSGYAIKDLNWTTNPRSVTQKSLEELYRAAW